MQPPRETELKLERATPRSGPDPDAVGYTNDEMAATAERLLRDIRGGINLEYYFSHVDSPGYGCGTKLSHNVTSLVGVMDGAASDLRTGLPWQMVEIHEPVRLLFVVETRPEVILGLMAKNALIRTYVEHGWVQMTVLDPDSGTIQMYKDGSFHPYAPTAAQLLAARSSSDWYRGWRDHLEFAVIG